MASIKPTVVPARIEHCELMAHYMRDIDKREVWASGAMLPYDSLAFSLKMSDQCFAVIPPDSHIPIMMFGIGHKQSIFENKRQIWMLATDRIEEIPMTFLRHCGNYLTMIAEGSTVYNYVIEGNNKTLKWLYWLGFTILKAKPHGMLGYNFHYVQKEVQSCATSQQQH